MNANYCINELLAYAFFESLLIGGEYTCFLADELLPRTGEIAGFLGDFKSVLPTDDPFVCRLIYQKGERLFEARDFKVSLKKDKITDITG